MPSILEQRKIERRVNELLLQHGIDSLPVPVEKIARSQGVEVIPYDLGNEVSGVLIIGLNGGTIGINPTQSKTRQRFTVGHELGHYILHRGEGQKELFVDKDFIVKFRSKKNYTAKEQKLESEANAFAAALLMPRELIYKEIEKERYNHMSELEFIEGLAKACEVSIPAMTYRIPELSIGH